MPVLECARFLGGLREFKIADRCGLGLYMMRILMKLVRQKRSSGYNEMSYLVLGTIQHNEYDSPGEKIKGQIKD